MAINLVFYEGIMGSGKTSRMSLDALFLKKQNPNITLYSNYGLKGSLPFVSFSQFTDIPLNEGTIICLDESHIDLSNRDYALNSVKFMVNMIFYLRKMRCTIFMTSPLFANIDSKVREVTNILVRCSKTKDGFIAKYYNLEQMKFLYAREIKKTTIKMIAGFVYDTNIICLPLEYPEKRDDYNKVFENMKTNNERRLLA